MARAATVVLGVFAMVLGIVFKGQNVAFMVGLAFAIAASANFPALLLSMVWKSFTTRGAVAADAVDMLRRGKRRDIGPKQEAAGIQLNLRGGRDAGD